MTPEFGEPAAARAWRGYFAEVDALLAGRDPAERAALRAELEAHLADGFAAETGGGEAERLARATARLGRPGDYLRPMLADAPIGRGARSYAPAPIALGLYHSVRVVSTRAAVAAAFALGYAALAVFAAMAALKPVWGDHVGLFRGADGAVSFGIVANRAGADELLGLWVVPIALLAAGLLHAVLTRALRHVRFRA